VSGKTPGDLYIGLMSGTSMDGIDAALVCIDTGRCEVLATYSHAYAEALQGSLIAAARTPEKLHVDEFGRLDGLVGEHFRDAALTLLSQAKVPATAVRAIGSHGQTVRHLPDAVPAISLQIGDPNIIAAGTGITTVADFRRADIALGGQGAPLAPAFHAWLFASAEVTRVVLNLGGMANLTVLPGSDAAVRGFDTGPGNRVMDAWIRRHQDLPFDQDGHWAATAKPHEALVERLLADPYFALPPPKSTGFEHFNLQWLDAHLADFDLSAATVQASLLELTVRSVAADIEAHAADAKEIAVCGGGVRNGTLMDALSTRLAPRSVRSTTHLGVDPEWVEAAAFAWLASRTLNGQPGNLPSVTGAQRPAVLGAIYPARCS